MAPDYIDQFKRLRVDKAHKPPRVHKPCMLLVIIDLAERGALSENTIRYEDTLEGFAEYAEAVRPGENLQAFLPFFHLTSEDFWLLHPKNGASDEDRRPKHRSMLGRHASLVPDGLRTLMSNSARARDDMRAALIGHWFPERRDSVDLVVNSRRSANEYEKSLRTDEATGGIRPPNDNVRQQSFRRLVLEAYDYRCAATGWRILVPGVGPLVDAAHLVPFKETHDDRPCNGIALTPTYHRALDRRLIAPGLDMKWRISRALDKRIRDNQVFTELEGQAVIYHGRGHHHPAPEALQWRIERLLDPGT